MFTRKPDGPLCPHFQKECIRDRCVSWHADILEKAGETSVHSACMQFFWIPLYLKGIAHRADGTQRAVESSRNRAAQDAAVIAGGLAAVAEAVSNRGGFEVIDTRVQDCNELASLRGQSTPNELLEHKK